MDGHGVLVCRSCGSSVSLPSTPTMDSRRRAANGPPGLADSSFMTMEYHTPV